MKFYGKTDTGLSREQNEDSFFREAPCGMFDALMVVADGMGGGAFGEIASSLATQSVANTVSKNTLKMPGIILNQAVSLANLKVRQKMETIDCRVMGTTLVIAGVTGNRLYVANVGDSRLYVLRKDSGMEQITLDHSYVEEMVRQGKMVRGSLEYRTRKSAITRAIGMGSEVEADIFEIGLHEGDMVLLCSDGLSNMVPDEHIEEIIKEFRGDLCHCVDELVYAANEQGGHDNITVILYEHEEV